MNFKVEYYDFDQIDLDVKFFIFNIHICLPILDC